MMKRNFIGKTRYINTGSEMSDEYYRIFKEDLASANILAKHKNYSQALYFLIQAMEKYIKYSICLKIDITNKYYADKIRRIGHSFDRSIEFLIDIMAGTNVDLKAQINRQINELILHNVSYGKLHNDVRYPAYIEKTKSYRTIEISSSEYNEVVKQFKVLKSTIDDLMSKF